MIIRADQCESRHDAIMAHARGWVKYVLARGWGKQGETESARARHFLVEVATHVRPVRPHRTIEPFGSMGKWQKTGTFTLPPYTS